MKLLVILFILKLYARINIFEIFVHISFQNPNIEKEQDENLHFRDELLGATNESSNNP